MLDFISEQLKNTNALFVESEQRCEISPEGAFKETPQTFNHLERNGDDDNCGKTPDQVVSSVGNVHVALAELFVNQGSHADPPKHYLTTADTVPDEHTVGYGASLKKKQFVLTHKIYACIYYQKTELQSFLVSEAGLSNEKLIKLKGGIADDIQLLTSSVTRCIARIRLSEAKRKLSVEAVNRKVAV